MSCPNTPIRRQAYGGEVPVIAQVAKGQVDMGAVLGKLAAADPDGAFFPLFPADFMSLFRKAAAAVAIDGTRSHVDLEFSVRHLRGPGDAPACPPLSPAPQGVDNGSHLQHKSCEAEAGSGFLSLRLRMRSKTST